MARPYDPDLDFVHVKRDGRILWDGQEVGYVYKVEGTLAAQIGKWRAELGNPGKPTGWPPYRVGYDQTRKGAVALVLDGLEVPDA